MNSRSLKLFEQAIRSPQTHKVYMYSLHEFMKFIKIEKYNDIPKLDSEKIQKFLEDWVMNLSGRGLKANTIIGKLSAVELFLDMNKVTFHKKIIHRLVPSTDYIPGGDKAYTTEEIKRITWFGKLSYRQLKVPPEPRITKCPVCGGLFEEIYYIEEFHPVAPPDKPYEGLVDSDGWYRVGTGPEEMPTDFDYAPFRDLNELVKGLVIAN